MPSAPRIEINRAVRNGLHDSGVIPLLETGGRANPRRFIVADGSQQWSVWVYIWTLTPGGRPKRPHEFRIQMTGVSPPLPRNPNGFMAIIGYDPNLGVLAGFDIDKHAGFSPGSPSVQIDTRSLNEALQSGFGFDFKQQNAEIAIGIRSDHLWFYLQNAKDLHQFGSDAEALALLEGAARRDDGAPEVTNLLPPDRERVVSEVSRLARSSSFRLQVLQAYGYRCAVTRIQLRVVEAAHIFPAAAGAVDDVRNGLALSATYHRAFDRGLIYLDESLNMRLNPQEAEQLRVIERNGGLTALEESLGRIHLPQDSNQWPHPDYIRMANQHRGIQ